jgi:hypothetical protein
VPYNDNIKANVAFMEQRARDAAQQEMERSSSLDQKTAGLIAAGLVLLAAGVAFIGNLEQIHVGEGAKTYWVALVVLTLVLLLGSLSWGTAAIWPQAYRVVLAVSELDRWARPSFLSRDPTTVQGEMMRGSITAARNARPVNLKKANRLKVAFWMFGTGILCIVVLAASVAIRLASEPHHKQVSSKHERVVHERRAHRGHSGRD